MRGALLAVAACVVVLARLVHRRKQKDLPKIPLAPRTLPVIGNISAVKAVLAYQFHKFYVEYGDVAGEAGVLRLCIAGQTVLILTTPAALAAVLSKTGFVPKPLSIYSAVLMFGTKRHSLFSTQDGAEHDRIRRCLARCFNADNVAEAIDNLTANVATAIAAISSGVAAASTTPGSDTAAATDAPDGSLLTREDEQGVCVSDINEAGVLMNGMRFTAYNIITTFQKFVGVDFLPPIEELKDTLLHAAISSIHPLQYPLLKRGLYPGYRRYRHNWDTLYEFHCEVVREIFSRPAPDNTRTLWAALRDCFPNAMTDEADFDGAVANVSLIYVAGFETTSNAIMHTLSALALDQKSQTFIAEELKAAGVLATPQQPNPPPVTSAHLHGLKMLDAVCHESLRLMAPVPGSARELRRDTEIGGYKVPKGTDVVLAIGAVHTNAKAWGEDAQKWRPLRWLEGKSKAAMKRDANGNLRFLPFLDGGTSCIGQHLALLELKMVVAMVLSRLHVTMDQEHMGHLKTVEDYVAETIFMVTLQRATPSWLRMRPRAC